MATFSSTEFDKEFSNENKQDERTSYLDKVRQNLKDTGKVKRLL
jgi:hypothetical protein